MTTTTEREAWNRARVFIMGWNQGRRSGFPSSPREAEAELRRLYMSAACDDAVDIYCNGTDDGASGETVRLVASRETMRRIAAEGS